MAEMCSRKVKKVLTIAGSDSGGGAGIQADLKTFAALGVYGTSVVTAVTAQNTLGVQGVSGLLPAFVGQQIDSVLKDISTDVVKTGMLYSAEIVEVVAEKLKFYEVPCLIVDPVMVATSEDRLLTLEGERALRDKLFPIATFITPNVAEASALCGCSIEDKRALYAVARELKKMGPDYVVITGFRQGDCYLDLFYDGYEFFEIKEHFLEIPHTHGTGCTFSAALAAFLARGASPLEAVATAKNFVTIGLRYAYQVGDGIGPLNHMASFFPGAWDDPVAFDVREYTLRGWGTRPELGPFPSLYVILGGGFCQGKNYAELTRAVIRGGARLVQLREKEGDARELVKTACMICDVCRTHGTLFIVNDRVDVAAASGADGVHLGQKDIPPRVARVLLGSEKIIGVSVANLEQAEAAVKAGADYLGLGPVYPTTTKDCGVSPCGASLIADVVVKVPVPVFVIGGITPENTLPLLEAGAAGVAVISAVLGVPDSTRAARAFLDVFAKYRAVSGISG